MSASKSRALFTVFCSIISNAPAVLFPDEQCDLIHTLTLPPRSCGARSSAMRQESEKATNTHTHIARTYAIVALSAVLASGLSLSLTYWPMRPPLRASAAFRYPPNSGDVGRSPWLRRGTPVPVLFTDRLSGGAHGAVQICKHLLAAIGT